MDHSRDSRLTAAVLGGLLLLTACKPSLWTPQATIVTLYFSDGEALVPVSRRVPSGETQLRAVLEALLAGPGKTSGLVNPIPSGVVIRSATLTGDVAHIDLSAHFLNAQNGKQAQAALVETITALRGVRSVALSIEGQPLGPEIERVPLLYYAWDQGLVAVPVSAVTPQDLAARYLEGPPNQKWTGLPADVRLLNFTYNSAERALSLNFSYPPSVRALAMERPERMRFVLLGLIASLTEFPGVDTVRLDFEGKARLGVGQCSDLLRTPQEHPKLLNDERLLVAR